MEDFVKQINQLPTKSHDELEDNSNVGVVIKGNIRQMLVSKSTRIRLFRERTWLLGHTHTIILTFRVDRLTCWDTIEVFNQMR